MMRSAIDVDPTYWLTLLFTSNFRNIVPPRILQTPIVIDWSYNNGGQIAPMTKQGVDWKVVVPSDAPPISSFYMATINKDAAHPAAARCWVEYLFSDAGQNTWLKGFATPVRLPAMQAAGTADAEAVAALGAPADGAGQVAGGGRGRTAW